ncbi:MAG: ATP-binding protein [Anaerolineae bacterium]|nr:ATP-binding protein [Anaerolineae bacterium]
MLLNRLKTEVCRDWLTDSQSVTLAEIERLWCFPERVNLYGPPGSGKTLLGWTVARVLHSVVYASAHSYYMQAASGQTHVVIDNAPDDALALRRLIAELQLNDTRTVLVITTQPNHLGLPTIALPIPTHRDVDIVYRNLSLLDYYASNPLYDENLWAVIGQVL